MTIKSMHKARSLRTRKAAANQPRDKSAPGDAPDKDLGNNQNKQHKEDFEQLLDDAVLGVKPNSK